MKSRPCAATRAPRFSKTAAGIALAATFLMAGALPAQAQSGNTGPDKVVGPAKASSAPGAKAKASSAPGAKAKAGAADPKSQASYSLGVSVGTQLHGMGLNADAVSYERVMQGLKDALGGKATVGADDGQRIQTLIEDARNSQGTINKAAADKFLADNGKLPGVVTTASGLQYKVIKAGTGEAPKPTDEATVNYRGTLLNGTEFDSSYKRNQPATFPINQVIKGWQEALLLMKPGSKVELYIPPALAYDMNSPPPIPPGSLLKFEVELLSVKPASAASAPGAALPPKHP